METAIIKNQTQTSLTNGQTISALKFRAIAGVINKLRIVQGWNMISPKDAEPIGAVWIEQLDRYKVAPELYEPLLNRCIDRRARILKEGGQPPALTVELFLAEFEAYKSEIRQKFNIIASLRHIKHELYCAKETIKPFVPTPQREYEVKEEFSRFMPKVKSEAEQLDDYNLRRANLETMVKRVGKYESIEDMIEKYTEEIEQRTAKAEKLWKESFIQEPMPPIE